MDIGCTSINESSDDEDLYLGDMHPTPGGQFLPLLPYAIGDLVQINSDPEDDEKESHLHCGYITKQTNQQITIKKDTGSHSYFVDDISIKLITKANDTNLKKADIKTEIEVNADIEIAQIEAKPDIKEDEKTEIALADIKTPALYEQDDLFFGHFDSKRKNKELEANNDAVRNLFSINIEEQKSVHMLDRLSSRTPPPLQGKNSFEHIPKPESIQVSQSHSHGLLSHHINTDNNNMDVNINSFKCFVCKQAIKACDWTLNNAQQINNNKWKHKVCTYKRTPLFIDKYESNAIDDDHEALMMEVMIRLHMKQAPNKELVDDVLNVKQYAKYEELLEKVGNIQSFGEVITKQSVVIRNKIENESILMHCYDEKEFIVYDTHSRPKLELNGSHLLVFSDRKDIELHLEQVWPSKNNECEWTLFKDKESQDIDLEQLDPEIRQYIDKLLKQIADLQNELKQLKSQNVNN